MPPGARNAGDEIEGSGNLRVRLADRPVGPLWQSVIADNG